MSMSAIDTSRRDTAMALAAAGVRVLCIVGPQEGPEPQRGKAPRGKAWQRSHHTPGELAAQWDVFPDSNVGVITGIESGLICVDIDPRNGGDAWLLAHKAQLQDGHAEETGSGGVHIWYRHPGGYVASSSSRIAPGVDLLADGGHQAVVSPSVHRLGGRYTWRSTMPLADVRDFGTVLPSWIAEAGERPAPKAARRDETYTDRPEDVELCWQRLAALPEEVGGFPAGCLGRDHSLSPEAFLPLLLAWNEARAAKGQEPWSEPELVQRMNNAYRYSKASEPGTSALQFRPLDGQSDIPAVPALSPEAAATQSAAITDWRHELLATDAGWKNHSRNVELVLTHDPRLKDCVRYNLLTEAVEVARAPWRTWVGTPEWSDSDAVAFTHWLARAFNDTKPALKPEVVHQGASVFARQHAYHPVRDYLNGLTWDAQPRIDAWLCDHFGAANSEYVRGVGRRFLISAIARVMEPGCKVDAMLILEGAQGMMKSSAVRALFGAQWFTDTEIEIGSKDAAAVIRGRWCVEIPELTAAGKAEVNLLKAFVSRQVDRQRDAYARTPEDHPRQNVFVGTTNQSQYLRDITGGRRFWPVTIGKRADVAGMAAARDQLWAEAYTAYQLDEQHWLTDSEEVGARAEQDERYTANEWESQIAAWLDKGGDFVEVGQPIVPLTQVTGREVWLGAVGGSLVTFTRQRQGEISECMQRLGFSRMAIRRNGRVEKGYKRLDGHTSVTT